MDIIKAIEDERFFRPLFKDLSTWCSWLVFLRALFGLPIVERKERNLFKQCTGLKKPPRKPARECFVIVGRRGGKSRAISVTACYLACFKDWRPFLALGERAYIFIVAVDKKQAAIIKGYITAILHSNRIFENMIERETTECIDLTNSVSIMIKTASYRSIRGYAIVCGILEECSFFRSDESANPDREILNALRPALATIPQSLLIAISTPYSRSGVLWEQYSSHFGSGDKDAPLIWKSDARTMNPTISKKLVDDALKKDYAAAKAEWLAEFREDIESFLPFELIEEATIPGRLELPKIEGVQYFAHTDPSGGRGDSMTLAVAHKDLNTDKIILDCLREARPPFKPQRVVGEFSKVLLSYGIRQICSDRYAGEWVSSSFRDYGIMVENSERSTSEIYRDFLPILSNRRVELLDSKRLVSQLRGLERKTRSGGKDIITHYPGGHDDVANAAAGALTMAARVGSFRLPLPSLGYIEDDETPEARLIRESTAWLLDRTLPKSEEDNFDEAFWDLSRMSALDVRDELDRIEEDQDKKSNKRRTNYEPF
jgi:hypothetical protein